MFHRSPRPPTTRYDPLLPLLFMHVPKTSGTALTQGLIGAIAPRRAVSGFDRCCFGAFDAFESLADDLRSTIYLDPAELPAADFVSGHMACSTFTHRYPDGRLITFLREPRSRLLSFWLFWRAEPEEECRRWGGWSASIRKARGRLSEFLAAPEIAQTTDNIYVRMLLWPHPLIPDDGYIDGAADKALVTEAAARLRRFAYADIVENPLLAQSLGDWLGRPFVYPRINENHSMPAGLKSPIDRELTTEALDLLDVRSRLDRALWTTLAQARLHDANFETVRERTLLHNIARYAALMVV